MLVAVSRRNELSWKFIPARSGRYGQVRACEETLAYEARRLCPPEGCDPAMDVQVSILLPINRKYFSTTALF